LLLSKAQFTFVPKTTKTRTSMLLNEQKKQALERYINQFYTQQQIANALGNKSAKPATQFQPTSCQSFNSENPDSDNISATPTATTSNKSAIPTTHESAISTATTGNKPAIPGTTANYP